MLIPENGSVSGLMVLEELNRFSCDKVFVGATTVSASRLMFWNADEAVFTRRMISRGQKAYVLAESEKFGKESFYECCSLTEVDGIITDNHNPIPSELMNDIQRTGVTLFVAEEKNISEE